MLRRTFRHREVAAALRFSRDVCRVRDVTIARRIRKWRRTIARVECKRASFALFRVLRAFFPADVNSACKQMVEVSNPMTNNYRRVFITAYDRYYQFYIRTTHHVHYIAPGIIYWIIEHRSEIAVSSTGELIFTFYQIKEEKKVINEPTEDRNAKNNNYFSHLKETFKSDSIIIGRKFVKISFYIYTVGSFLSPL